MESALIYSSTGTVTCYICKQLINKRGFFIIYFTYEPNRNINTIFDNNLIPAPSRGHNLQKINKGT